MPTLTKPKISDVAQTAGVSTATVSRVINGSGAVLQATAERVWRAIEQLNYTPHPGARGLAGGRTKTLGLVLPGTGGYFISALLDGISRQVRDSGYELIIYLAREGPERRELLHWPMNAHSVDGLIGFTGSFSSERLGELAASGLPLVLLHQSSPPGLRLPSVSFANEESARRLVDHLIVSHGCRRIAFLAGPAGHEDSHERELGYRQALAARGLPADEQLVIAGGFDDRIAETAVSRLLRDNPGIEAICAADDASAMGALSAIRAAGLRVPEDIAVTGFDDASQARHLHPPLTTARAPIRAAGQAAVSLLLALIDGESVALTTTLPAEVIIRRSCGCRCNPIENGVD